jgi:uncharacterized membrane protein YfcA
MPSHIWLYLLALVFLAYFCKAMTGFGSSIIMIALGSLVIGPVPALVLTALLDVISGFTLLRLDSTKDTRRLWVPLSLAMFLGVIAGGLLLKLLALQHLQYVIAGALLVVAIWLLFFRSRSDASGETPLPESYRPKDLVICLVAGASGGVTGISAPPLLYHFGRSFTKEATRRILTRVFLVESATRVVIYSALSVIQVPILIISLISIPFMFVGLYAGNRAFFRVPEACFSRVTGVVVMAAVIRLMWRHIG